MNDQFFLEKLYNLIEKYCYNNPNYEDINDGQNFKYSNGDTFCIEISIEKICSQIKKKSQRNISAEAKEAMYGN